jgi:hypothetical protein
MQLLITHQEFHAAIDLAEEQIRNVEVDLKFLEKFDLVYIL